MTQSVATSAGPPVLALDALEVRLAGRLILRGLTGELRGRAIGLLGPNGAGKTTLLQTLLGFHRPSAGTVRILGHDIRTEPRAVRGLLGYMPENDAFIAGMSAVRFLRLMGELSGLPKAAAIERAHDALFAVGLGEARYRKLETFSLGMKQRAKLAQALVAAPRLLLLDEPTNGLDPPARQRMIELIRRLRESEGVSLLLSSHLLRDVEECCDEVLVLHQGRIAAHCDLEAERRANRCLYEIELRGPGRADAAAFAEGLGALGFECALAGERRLKVVLPEGVGAEAIYRLADERSVQLRRFQARRDSLEDIFFQAVGEIRGSR